MAKDEIKVGPSGIQRLTKRKNAAKKKAQHLVNMQERADKNRGKGRK